MKKIFMMAVVAFAAGSNAIAGEAHLDRRILSQPSWEARANHFLTLYGQWGGGQDYGKELRLDPADAAVVIALLRKEAHFTGFAPKSAEDEGFSDYLSDVIEIVSRLHTPAAAEALLDPAVLVTGTMATSGVSYGAPEIVPAVLQSYDTYKAHMGDEYTRDGGYALSLVIVMNSLLARQISSADRSEIEGRLLEASRSSDPLYRSAAVKGLAQLRDGPALARLRTMGVLPSPTP